MREYYESCKNILTTKPKTALEITKELFPRISEYEAYKRKEAIKRSLNQLKENGLADSYRVGNETYWALNLNVTDWNRMSIQDRIKEILKIGTWQTTRQIASQIYEDFDGKTNGANYTARTNRNLHRMKEKGIVEHNTELFSKYYLKVSAWKLVEKEVVA